MKLFSRSVTLEAELPNGESREWKGPLYIVFEVVRTSGEAPNSAKISIYNLSANSKHFLQEKNASIRLLAGYGEQQILIFSGDIVLCKTKTDGADVEILIEAKDGGRSYTESVASFGMQGPILAESVLEEILSVLKLPKGQVPAQYPKMTYLEGFTYVGPVRNALHKVTSDMGLIWSVQDGSITITGKSVPVNEQVYTLSPSSGLIGSPERVDQSNRYRVLSLLNGNIYPRRLIKIESETLQGDFICISVKHYGDNGKSNNFYSEMECESAR